MKDGEKWEVIEQPCGCCGVKSKDGKVWGYPMVRGAAEAVVDFANWLEREQSLDKQPGEAEESDGWKKAWAFTLQAFEKLGEPDVVRDVTLGDGTYEVKTLASSKEFKEALDRGDSLVYARRQLGGTWDYIVEKFPLDLVSSDDPIRQIRVKPLLEDARALKKGLETLSSHRSLDWGVVESTWAELRESAYRLVEALGS